MSITLKELPCIKDQAYFIMVGIEGSWLVEATFPHNQEEEWCKKFVKEFVDSYGWLEDYPNDKHLLSIQQMIDDSYEEVLQYRMEKLVNKIS